MCSLRWWDYQNVDEATEREHIRLAVEVQQKVVGSRPLGIYQVHIFLFFVCSY